MSDINGFIASMKKARGFARANQYEVKFNLPPSLHNLQANFGKQLTLHCDSISMPGHDLQTQTRQYGSEPTRDMVTSHGYEGAIQASFYLDSKLNELQIFQLWQEMAVSTGDNKANYYDDYIGDMSIFQMGSANATLSLAFDERSSDILRGGRKEGYESEAYGHQNTITKHIPIQTEDAKYAIKVEEVYPATIGDIEYGYASDNTIIKVVVGFNFRKWRNITHTLRSFELHKSAFDV
jgi:hypothetical protein|tara:strand:+ start:21 stop:731 length:711 start_codon:yes stop_codon:yes gene_type:complete